MMLILTCFDRSNSHLCVGACEASVRDSHHTRQQPPPLAPSAAAALARNDVQIIVPKPRSCRRRTKDRCTVRWPIVVCAQHQIIFASKKSRVSEILLYVLYNTCCTNKKTSSLTPNRWHSLFLVIIIDEKVPVAPLHIFINLCDFLVVLVGH